MDWRKVSVAAAWILAILGLALVGITVYAYYLSMVNFS
jgi:hypothetical protein